MNWVLFCQIEIILLTVGLVVSFIFSSYQSFKDRSWFQRVRTLGEIVLDGVKNINNEREKKNEN